MNYKEKILPKRQKLTIRSLNYNVYTWGNADHEPVFMLHGWGDTGRSFQFLVDAMEDDWYFIAPDWRGFGESDWAMGSYWFPDYLADLDVLIKQFAANTSVKLLGHSMGGNIACLYAGIRPDNLSHLISLDAFGLENSQADMAPERYRQWLDQWHLGPLFVEYDDIEAVMGVVRKLAPYINEERLRFVAEQWSKPASQGGYVYKFDPGHKRVNPVLYRREEARYCWRRIEAKTLLVLGKESQYYPTYLNEGGREDIRECINNLSESVIDEAGHLLHLEQPERLAEVVTDFLKT